MNQNKSRAKEAYFLTFIHLWETKPFEEITVSEIISESSYCKAGFYRYFHDKFDLAEQLFQREAIEYIDSIIYGLLKYTNSADRTKDIISYPVLQHVYEHKNLYHLIINSNIPDLNLDYFCSYALKVFRENKTFVINTKNTIIDPEFFYFCTTRQFIQYICYWDYIRYSKSAKYMSKQVSCMMESNEPGYLFSTNR